MGPVVFVVVLSARTHIVTNHEQDDTDCDEQNEHADEDKERCGDHGWLDSRAVF